MCLKSVIVCVIRKKKQGTLTEKVTILIFFAQARKCYAWTLRNSTHAYLLVEDLLYGYGTVGMQVPILESLPMMALPT